MVYRQRGDAIVGGHVGDDALAVMPIPPEHDNPWRVEEEFVRLVRGDTAEPSFSFVDGIANMEYLEAAYYAGVEGRRVTVRQQ